MRRLLMRQWVGLVGGGLILLLPTGVPAQAPDALVVFYQSLTAGLNPGTDDCTDALRSLTAGLLSRSSLTHVVQVGTSAERAIAELAPRVPLVLLAYTLQGPQNEVGILVCAPADLTKR